MKMEKRSQWYKNPLVIGAFCLLALIAGGIVAVLVSPEALDKGPIEVFLPDTIPSDLETVMRPFEKDVPQLPLPTTDTSSFIMVRITGPDEWTDVHASNTANSDTIGSAYQGVAAEYLGTKGDWYRIGYYDTTGYISAQNAQKEYYRY